VTSVPGTAVWTDAVQLKRRLADGEEVVSGLLDDGLTVRVSAIDELGETYKFSNTFPIQVMSHDLIDSGGEGQTDIAVVTSVGLFVFDRDGGLLRREQVVLTDGGTVTFGSTDHERLAFWYQNGTGLSYLRVIDGPTTEAEIQLTVQPPWAGAPVDVVPSFMTVGDFNYDLNDDLFVQIHHEFGVLLINQGDPTAHFDVVNGGYETLALSNNPQLPTNPGVAYAYFGNMDGDDGADLAIPLNAKDLIKIFTREGLLNPGGSGTQKQVGRGSADLVAPESTYWWGGLPGQEVGHLNLALDVPPDFMPGGLEDYTHVEVVSWFQVGIGGDLLLLGEQNTLHELDPASVYQWIDVAPLQVGVPVPNSEWPDEDNIWVVFRFVNADPVPDPPRINKAGRFMIGAFTLHADDEDDFIPPYLGLLEGAGFEVRLDHRIDPYDSGEVEEGNYVGAWVPQNASVLFQPGNVPQIPGAEVGDPMKTY
jgi:hypothetical protein